MLHSEELCENIKFKNKAIFSLVSCMISLHNISHNNYNICNIYYHIYYINWVYIYIYIYIYIYFVKFVTNMGNT